MSERRTKRNLTIFRILRLCLGLNLNELSDKTGISKIYLNELELGTKLNPSKDVIEKLSHAYGIRADTLHYFLEDKEGQSFDYQQKLLCWLERAAEKSMLDAGQ